MLHTLSVAVMINGFLALNNLAFGAHVAPQVSQPQINAACKVLMAVWWILAILDDLRVRHSAKQPGGGWLTRRLLASGITMILAAASDLLPAVTSSSTLFHPYLR